MSLIYLDIRHTFEMDKKYELANKISDYTSKKMSPEQETNFEKHIEEDSAIIQEIAQDSKLLSEKEKLIEYLQKKYDANTTAYEQEARLEESQSKLDSGQNSA